ncbi:MAG: hypothetical protein LBT78_06570 [Tannerella sp.]|nr:hypothetical protein [Tannerella sp.]
MQRPEAWLDYEKVLGLQTGLRQYNYDVTPIASTAPANIFWPGDSIRFNFQLANNTSETIDCRAKIQVIRYGAKGIPNDIWLPQMVKMDYEKEITAPVFIPSKGYVNVPVAIDDIKEYGGYAVVFDLGKNGRRLGASFVYSMKPSPIKMQYPKQSLDDLGTDFLSRVGVQSIRRGVPYIATTGSGYQSYMQEFKEQMKKYMDNNITVMLMFGEGGSAMPLGRPRSFLDENGVFLRSKQDHVWLPEIDEDFKIFVKSICLEYGWPKGPVTAVSLWNEPWEGLSISGWQADMIRYREIYTKMAEAVLEARKENVDVLIGGGDSSTNAWDKFFGDGTMDFLPVFDFLSIHYQGMESPVLHPEWNNRQDHKGRVLIWDTESWVGNTDDRIGLVVAVNRSAGYDRSMGIYGGYMYSGNTDGRPERVKIQTENGIRQIPAVPSSWSPAAAMGAVQSLIGERDFDELMFKNGLPWVISFHGYDHNNDDGTVVIAGDLGEAFGAENVLFRNVRSLTETKKRMALHEQLQSLPADSREREKIEKELEKYYPVTDGKMTIKAHPSFLFFDFYGNKISSKNNQYEIPLNYQGYFMRTDGSKGSFAKLTNAIRNARIEGYEPVEIIAKDMTAPISDKPEMELCMTNILNRPVTGRLQVSLGNLQVSVPEKISLKPNETKNIKVKITGGEANAENNYPLQARFDAGNDGFAIHWEDMHVNVIAKRKITVDGELNDWDGVIQQTIKGSSKSNISLTEAAWHPYLNFDENAGGLAQTYMAYDDNYFYFAAKVADKTPDKGTLRFENRNDDEYFYPDTAYMQTIYAMQSTPVKQTDSGSDKKALLLPDGKGRVLNYLENTSTTQSIGMDIDLPDDKYTRTSFYFLSINDRGVSVAVSDRTTGKELLSAKISDWDGYLTLDLCGKIRVRCSADGWWYPVRLAGIFFDASENIATKGESSALLIKTDFDTAGDWVGKYGNSGYYLVGSQSSLPLNTTCNIVSEDDKVPLIWPEGVRHFTYRKNPVLPDGVEGGADNIQIAFNVIPVGEDGMEAMYKGTMPRYIGYKCTDYEYALNTVAPEYGGGFEIWRLLVPGMPRKHFYPRQGKSPYDGAVKDGQLITLRKGNTLYTECAIPWSELPDVKKAIDKGGKIKFSVRINDDGAGGACMETARDRSVSKRNSRAFHPDWKIHWANEVEFATEK